METTPEQDTQPVPRLACYLRLTEDEFKRLQNDSKKSGKKATTLLKKAYFEKE